MTGVGVEIRDDGVMQTGVSLAGYHHAPHPRPYLHSQNNRNPHQNMKVGTVATSLTVLVKARCSRFPNPVKECGRQKDVWHGGTREGRTIYGEVGEDVQQTWQPISYMAGNNRHG